MQGEYELQTKLHEHAVTILAGSNGISEPDLLHRLLDGDFTPRDLAFGTLRSCLRDVMSVGLVEKNHPENNMFPTYRVTDDYITAAKAELIEFTRNLLNKSLLSEPLVYN